MNAEGAEGVFAKHAPPFAAIGLAKGQKGRPSRGDNDAVAVTLLAGRVGVRLWRPLWAPKRVMPPCARL